MVSVAVQAHDSIVVRLERIIGNPLDSCFPESSLVLPNAAIGFSNKAYPLPSEFSICAVQEQIRTHEPDAFFVDPYHVFSGQRPFDSADRTFSGVENCVPTAVPTKAYRSKPPLSRLGRRARICGRASAYWAPARQDQFASQPPR